MVRRVTAAQAEALMAAGGIEIVDVRNPDEWQTGHLVGARLVPLAELRQSWDVANLHGSTLFVCARGARSLTAAEFAESRGLAEVYSLDGGMGQWVAEGRPVVRPRNEGESSRRLRGAEDASTGPREVDPELDAIVGANVKRLRTEHGFSLDVLAGASGVGRQTLGQIELGQTVPSIGVLWKIARAFDVPFSVLLARPEIAATHVLRQDSARRLVSADGRFSSRALFAPVDKGKVEFYELSLAGHSREEAEGHAPGTRENLIVTAGRLVIEIGRERFELAKGDAITFVADSPHAYVNPGSEECWMNLVMTY